MIQLNELRIDGHTISSLKEFCSLRLSQWQALRRFFMGECPVESGCLYMADEQLSAGMRLPKVLAKRCQWVDHESHWLLGSTPYQELSFICQCLCYSRLKRLELHMYFEDKLEIADWQIATETLSKEKQQHVALMRALLWRPDYLFILEPMMFRGPIWQLLDDLSGRGLTVIPLRLYQEENHVATVPST